MSFFRSLEAAMRHSRSKSRARARAGHTLRMSGVEGGMRVVGGISGTCHAPLPASNCHRLKWQLLVCTRACYGTCRRVFTPRAAKSVWRGREHAAVWYNSHAGEVGAV